MKLIVGLGNVGPRYAKTRHNIGFMVADELAKAAGATWKTDAKLQSAIIETELAGTKVVLAKPQTMMNLSGDAVQRLVQKYRLTPSDVWVMHDDVNVDFGKLRLRSGGASGQQGIKSIASTIGPDFKRVRLGISLNDRATEPSEVYVLKPFTSDEQAHLPAILSAAAGAIMERLGTDNYEENTINLN